MKFCPECGAKTDGSKFCPECGFKLDSFNNDSDSSESYTAKKKTEDNVSLDDLMSLALDAEKNRKQEKERKKLLDILSSFEYEEHADGTISIIKLKRKSNINVVLPDNVVSIEKEAFMDSLVMSVVLPEGIVRIGDRAFKGCKDLIKINIPSNVMILGDEVFEDCKQLEVEIPEGIPKKGTDILLNTKTERLKLEAERRKIAEEAEKLRKIEEEKIKAEERKEAERAEKRRKLEEEKKAQALEKKRLLQLKKQEEKDLKKRLEYEQIQAEKKKQAEEEEKRRKLEKEIREEKEKKIQQLIKINPHLEYKVCDNLDITVSGMKDNQALKKGVLEIPNGVEAIGIEAFREKNDIKQVILPPSVKTIDQLAFHSCENLKKINLENVINVKRVAFYSCKHLKKVDLNCAMHLYKSAFEKTAIKCVAVKKGVTMHINANWDEICFPKKCKIKFEL